MTVAWEQVQEAWAVQKVRQFKDVAEDVEVTIIDIDITEGGPVQIGDMTWDHDNPAVEIRFSTPHGYNFNVLEVDLDFPTLVRELVETADRLAAQ